MKAGRLAPDRTRRHLSREEWFQTVIGSGGLPAGHGFSAANTRAGRGDYVANPVPGIPLRLIVLDTCSRFGSLGWYGREHFESFLVPALEQAKKDRVLVIVASHAPSGSMPIGGAKLRRTLGRYENVLLHLVGHHHRNAVLAHRGSTPALGYWEVQTSSLIDWPLQSRLLELVDNRDGTAEIWLTMVDFDVDHKPTGPLAEAARFFAMYEVHSGARAAGREGKPGDRNAILPVMIPAAVRSKLAALPRRAVESALFA